MAQVPAIPSLPQFASRLQFPPSRLPCTPLHVSAHCAGCGRTQRNKAPLFVSVRLPMALGLYSSVCASDPIVPRTLISFRSPVNSWRHHAC